jgi:hypothetical protein
MQYPIGLTNNSQHDPAHSNGSAGTFLRHYMLKVRSDKLTTQTADISVTRNPLESGQRVLEQLYHVYSAVQRRVRGQQDQQQ